MGTKPLESILYRDFSMVQAKPIIDLACPLLQELVNFGTNTLVRCATSAKGDKNEDHALLSLYRHILEMTDASEVLIAHACAMPVVPLLRSSFEALISSEYIAEVPESYATRSLCWLLGYIHECLILYDLVDPATSLGAQFQKSIAADVTIQSLALPPGADFSKAAGKLRNLLATPQFAPIEEEYSNLKGPKKWHRLFGGPYDLRVLAHRVGKAAQYDFLYRYWSRVTHAQDFAPFIEHTTEGEGTIRGIRDISDLERVASFAAMFMLTATREIIIKFRPGEDIRSWYEREIRAPYMTLARRN